jgi:hypothetical protein
VSVIHQHVVQGSGHARSPLQIDRTTQHQHKKTYIESGRQIKEIKVSTDTHELRAIAQPLLRR